MTVDDETLTCCSKGCGIAFSVPAHWARMRRGDHTSWFCPNGHSQHFPGESDVEKMKRERDSARQALARVEDEKREAIAAVEREKNRLVAAAKAETKKLKKRAAAGTCPCCQRSFNNMTEHMKKQHPKFVAAEITNVVPLKKKA